MRRKASRARRSVSSTPTQPVFAVTGFTATDFYATASGGGESGVDTGFGSVVFIVPDTLTGSRFLQNRANSAVTAGHLIFLSAAAVAFYCASGAGGTINSPLYTVTAGQLGLPMAIIGWHDAARVRVAVNSFPQQGAGSAITGFTAFANTFTTSGVAGTPVSAPATGTRYMGGLTFRGTPTDAQLGELFSLFGRRWQIPTPSEWPYGMTHRWSVQESLALDSVAGQVGPSVIADSITGAAVDRLLRNGSPTLSLVGYR